MARSGHHANLMIPANVTSESRTVAEISRTTFHSESHSYAPYIFIKHLGEGGFGVTLLAFHPDRPLRFVVLKIPHASATASEQLRIEAATLRALSHPLIITFHDYVESPMRFLVMDFATGGSLSQKLRTEPEGRLPAAEASRLLYDVLRALDYVHHKGVLHLDIS